MSITHDDPPERIGPGVVIRGKHYMVLSNLKEAASRVRKLQMEVFQPDLLFFGSSATPEAHNNAHATNGALLASSLPANAALMTFQKLSSKKFLVRLSHQFGVNEDVKLSDNAHVSLSKLLQPNKVTDVKELTLTANRKLSELKRLRWIAEDGVKQTDAHPAAPVGPDFAIELTPLKIRTFEVTIA